MSNLLVIYEFDVPTVRIMKDCYSNLFQGTDTNFVMVQMNRIHTADVAWADVVLAVRPSRSSSLALIKRLGKTSKKIICFWDDDVLLLPSLTEHRKKQIIKIIKCADYFLTTNTRILKKYIDYTKGKKGIVTDTLVTEEDLSKIPDKEPSEKVKIVYAAGVNHEYLFNKSITPILPELFEKYGNRIQFDFICVRPQIPECLLNYNINFFPGMPLKEYRDFMINQKYDIGVSPIENTEFCNSKYFNKFIEYTLVGTVGIYSNCDPYLQIVEDKINGIFSDDSPEKWKIALETLIEDRQLREKCLNGAKNTLKQRLYKDSILENLYNNIPELSESHKTDDKKVYTAVPRFIAKCINIQCLIVAMFKNLSQNGISSTINKIRKHFN